MAQSAARNGEGVAPNDWSSLAARFRSIIEAPSGTLPHLFAESFARSFIAAYRHNTTEPTRN
jgi:hypothetical protein